MFLEIAYTSRVEVVKYYNILVGEFPKKRRHFFARHPNKQYIRRGVVTLLTRNKMAVGTPVSRKWVYDERSTQHLKSNRVNWNKTKYDKVSKYQMMFQKWINMEKIQNRLHAGMILKRIYYSSFLVHLQYFLEKAKF